MKKIGALLLVAILSVTMLAGCGDTKPSTPSPIIDEPPMTELVEKIENNEANNQGASDNAAQGEQNSTETPAPVEVDLTGKYRSELTNEPIDAALENQRPIAVMIDNEKTALDHYGINQADIVYELMNSTANGRITRLMAVMKDWQNIEQLGSIRSARQTNFMLAAEYNAIIIHDGGPFYINEWVARKYTNNLSGGFARFSNGKATEYTEYVTSESYTNTTKGQTYLGLKDRIKKAGYSTEYNSYYNGRVFSFSDTPLELRGMSGGDANIVDLPFPHNKSELHYNESTKLYEYYEYDNPHVDALTGEVTSFKNVIVYNVTYAKLDDNGYLIYNAIGSGNEGFFISEGYAVPITWSKASESERTIFKYKETGEEIVLNTGKTYIALVPSDVWNELSVY